MKVYTLKNGLKVIHIKRKSNPLVLGVVVKVGSNYENNDELGLSHFMEHMIFCGTKKRNVLQISSEIENLGGEINANTSNERTYFYISVLKKHFDKALDVLSDIVQNPLFNDEYIEKERKVVLDELNMYVDDPKAHQWELFQKALYKKNKSKDSIVGNKKVLEKLSRNDILKYYSTYYVPNNMALVLVGDIKNADKKIAKAFTTKIGKEIKKKNVFEPRQKQVRSIIQKRKIEQSYLILGYETVPRLHKDSYTLDVIKSILGKGQSSWLFDEIRNKRGLAYIVGAHYEPRIDCGPFAMFVGTDKKNLRIIKKIFLEQIKRLRKVTNKDVNDAINFIEGNYVIESEDNRKYADLIASCEVFGDLKLADKYLRRIKKVRANDVRKVARKYFKNNYSYCVISQK